MRRPATCWSYQTVSTWSLLDPIHAWPPKDMFGQPLRIFGWAFPFHLLMLTNDPVLIMQGRKVRSDELVWSDWPSSQILLCGLGPVRGLGLQELHSWSLGLMHINLGDCCKYQSRRLVSDRQSCRRKCGFQAQQPLLEGKSNKGAYLSFRSLTAFTTVRNESSPMHLSWWSSQSITLFGGNFGRSPPPTSARMLHLKSISTMPMPPSNSDRD